MHPGIYGHTYALNATEWDSMEKEAQEIRNKYPTLLSINLPELNDQNINDWIDSERKVAIDK